ncbi:endonuclease V [Thermosipho ferrireducens]|uniref:Endonuclease V n=1 Tax=Thermosipho ferrireducens TaxID=2571116 RepID=A0ABX7S5R4_9BACT|nr:endonuclease V [Thermosipho ferrireducens]QTA37901.1 endonuclease V [Thermosipho ferrireducens]
MFFRNLHSWNVSPKEAIDIQNRLKELLNFNTNVHNVSLVAGVDLSFFGEYGLAVIVVLDRNFDIKDVVYHVQKIEFPYVPGLLAFREGPVFLKAWEKLQTEVDVVFFDGHGIAHPRFMGIASHMGLFIEKPTIGVAKRKLVGNYENVPEEVYSYSYIKYNDKTIGIAFRSKKKTKPIFISPGNLIDLQSSLHITKLFLNGYKLPEPTRLAHIYTQKLKKEFIGKEPQ